MHLYMYVCMCVWMYACMHICLYFFPFFCHFALFDSTLLVFEISHIHLYNFYGGHFRFPAYKTLPLARSAHIVFMHVCKHICAQLHSFALCHTRCNCTFSFFLFRCSSVCCEAFWCYCCYCTFILLFTLALF